MTRIINMLDEDENPIEVAFTANAATPLRYKAIFNKDLLVLFQQSQDNGKYDLDFVQELAFVMAMQAKAKKGEINIGEVQKDDLLGWLEQFGGFEIFNAAEDIINIYMGNSITSSKEKKRARKQSEN